MCNILFVAPFSVNGGIASWAQGFYKNYDEEEIKLFPVDSASSHRKPTDKSLVKRVFFGLYDFWHLRKKIRSELKTGKYPLIHTTTSGNIGCFRDILICKLAAKFGCKVILHCHYGCITEDVTNKGLVGFLTRKAFSLCDQIWVLDKRSYATLTGMSSVQHKVCLTPNPIEIKYEFDNRPKQYASVSFLGNMIPTKGLFELVAAVAKIDGVRLDIIGPGTDSVVGRVKEIAGDKLDKSVFLHGRLPNSEAIELLKNIDILALPTYYPFEAFPISILEAMSLSKLVISTHRAAIPDMLTALDGTSCGVLVREKSIDDIVSAITYCQKNREEADEMCRKAYEKVSNAYATDIVYAIYTHNYKLLLSDIN